jgi:hypothetical protein
MPQSLRVQDDPWGWGTKTPLSERSILIMSEQQWDEIPSDLNSQLPIGAPSERINLLRGSSD